MCWAFDSGGGGVVKKNGWKVEVHMATVTVITEPHTKYFKTYFGLLFRDSQYILFCNYMHLN